MELYKFKELSVGTFLALLRNGIRTIEDLKGKSMSQLFALRGIGEVRLKEILEFAKRYDIYIKEDL